MLRRLTHRDSLAGAIDFQRLAAEEVAALGRVVRSLPREERSDGFWIDVSDQVSGLVDVGICAQLSGSKCSVLGRSEERQMSLARKGKAVMAPTFVWFLSQA